MELTKIQEILLRPNKPFAALGQTIENYFLKNGWNIASVDRLYNKPGLDQASFRGKKKRFIEDGYLADRLESGAKICFLLSIYKLTWFPIKRFGANNIFYIGKQQLFETINKFYEQFYGECPWNDYHDNSYCSFLNRLLTWSVSDNYFVIWNRDFFRKKTKGIQRYIYTSGYFIMLLPKFFLFLNNLFIYLKEFDYPFGLVEIEHNPKTLHLGDEYPDYRDRRLKELMDVLNMDYGQYAQLGATIKQKINEIGLKPSGVFYLKDEELEKDFHCLKDAHLVLFALMSLSSFTFREYGAREIYVRIEQIYDAIQRFSLYCGLPQDKIKDKTKYVYRILVKLAKEDYIDAYRLIFSYRLGRKYHSNKKSHFFIVLKKKFFDLMNNIKETFAVTPIWKSKSIDFDKLNQYRNVLKKLNDYAKRLSNWEEVHRCIPFAFWEKPMWVWYLLKKWVHGCDVRDQKVSIDLFLKEADRILNCFKDFQTVWHYVQKNENDKKMGWKRFFRKKGKDKTRLIDHFSLYEKLSHGELFFYKDIRLINIMEYSKYFLPYTPSPEDFVVWLGEDDHKYQFVPIEETKKSSLLKPIKVIAAIINRAIVNIAGNIFYREMCKALGKHWDKFKEKWGRFRKNKWWFPRWIEQIVFHRSDVDIPLIVRYAI